MKPVVVRNIKRADPNAIGTLGAVGVATVARGARALRPDEALHAADLGGRFDRRPGGHRAGAAGRQLDDPCRGRAMPERRRAGGRLHRRQYRRHVRRIAGDRAGRARRHRPHHRRRLPRYQAAQGDGLSGLVEGGLGQGHGQGHARRGQYSGGVRRRQCRAGRRGGGRRRRRGGDPEKARGRNRAEGAEAQGRRGRQAQAARGRRALASTCTRCARGWRKPGLRYVDKPEDV